MSLLRTCRQWYAGWFLQRLAATVAVLGAFTFWALVALASGCVAGVLGLGGSSADGGLQDAPAQADGSACGPMPCPAGTACDTLSGRCSTACSPSAPCSGGCCLNGACVAGGANSACGTDGQACAACGGGTPTCVSGACKPQCGGQTDGTCDGGNCCLAGKCVPGNATATCGYSGACVDCTGKVTGSRCVMPMGATKWGCGCTAKEDCPAAISAGGEAGYACDVNNASCTTICGVNGVTACNGGCCSGANGHCAAGNTDTVCGTNGGFCSNCAATCSPGPSCLLSTGTCGCDMGSGQCSGNAAFVCAQNGANRLGCNLASKSCCVPGVYGYADNGNPALCCSGKSMAGVCVCLHDGATTGNPATPYACCSLTVDVMGKCQCVANGQSCAFDAKTPFPEACCSNKASGTQCVCQAAGGPCQSGPGCCSGNCTNNVCI